MKHNSLKTLLTFIPAITLTLSACGNMQETPTEQSKSTASTIMQKNTDDSALKELFANKYKIGTALSREQIIGNSTNVLPFVNQQFNAVTPENSMKWERIHPEDGVYDFEAADALVEFSNKNNHFFTGHTLVWHSQVPDWVFEHKDGTPLNRAELLKRMEDHINTVAGRYAGKIDAWDVVNEALNEDGTLRKSKWLNIIGDDFIEQAFIMAAKAAPKAKLYYNDYNLYKPEKRNGVLNLVKRLQSKGIRIDSVGMQAHYSLTSPSLTEVEDSIKAYSALNIDVLITELDVSVIPFPDEKNMGADVSLNMKLQDEFNPYPNGLPTEIENQLGDRYRALFNIFNKHQDVIKRVTFWGVSDANTWRNDWPMPGRTDYPLLFDRQLKAKPFVSSLNKQ
ncbi:endo-1,4-beta-xylanase [Colwellia sp. RE-S-Sl-9]